MKAARDNSSPCHYRFWNEEGKLIYVGATTSLIRRMGQHLRTSPWWPEVTRIDVIRCDTIEEANRREADAARYGKPRYNIALTENKRSPRGSRDAQILAALDELGEATQTQLQNYFMARGDYSNWVGSTVTRMYKKCQIRVVRRDPAAAGKRPTRAVYARLYDFEEAEYTPSVNCPPAVHHLG